MVSVSSSTLRGSSAPRPRWSCGAAAIPRSSDAERDYRGRDARAARQGIGLGSQEHREEGTSPVCAWTTSSLSSSARTWATRRWWTTWPTRSRSRRARARPSRRSLHGFLPADGGDPHARRRDRLAHQQRPQPRRAPRGLRATRSSPFRTGARASSSRARWRRPSRRHPEGARPPAREARDDLLGRHRQGSLSRDDRADQPRRGGDRASRRGAGRASAAWRCLPRRRKSGGRWPSRWRPVLRGLVGRERRVVMGFDDAPDVLEFACSQRGGGALSRIGPATPDHTIYTKRLPCFARGRTTRRDPAAVARGHQGRRRALRRRLHRVRQDGQDGSRADGSLSARDQRWAGLGMFTTGKDRRTAGIVSDIYHHTISVLGAATSFGAYVLALRPGGLRRRVLAARALQAQPGAAREGAGEADRRWSPGGASGIGAGGRPAAGRRGRARGGGRSRRGRCAQGGRRGGRGGRGRRGPSASAWT